MKFGFFIFFYFCRKYNIYIIFLDFFSMNVSFWSPECIKTPQKCRQAPWKKAAYDLKNSMKVTHAIFFKPTTHRRENVSIL